MATETYSLVKDWLVAEEREPLTVRGLRHPVRVYAATGIYDAQTEQKKVLFYEDEGHSFTLDLGRLHPDARAAAIRRLKAMLSDLEN